MNHITLRLGTGTTQIDHILLSRFGVFVIETKDYTGWIFGSKTELAVKEFQSDKGLRVDGLVGSNTMKALGA